MGIRLSKEEAPKQMYICDPEKNLTCTGKNGPACGKQCFCTTNKDFSTNGKPITHGEYEIRRKYGK